MGQNRVKISAWGGNRLPRNCERCKRRFTPSGVTKMQVNCDMCRKILRKEGKL